MSEAKADRTRLGAAVAALEAELGRYEELALELQSGRLVSEKDLRRAAQSLNALRTSDGRLGELVQALVAAIGAARDRQQAQAEAVQARAEKVRARSDALGQLLARWEALGADAAQVNRLVQDAIERAGEGNGGETPTGLGPAFAEVDERLGRLAEDAGGLVAAAEADEFIDLARRADSLRAQLLTTRNRLRSIEKSR